MRKTIILVLAFLYASNLFSQSKTEVEDIFKMHLFLEKKNIYRSDLDNKISKNDSLYDSFKKSCSLKIDTLKIETDVFFPSDGDFVFFSLSDVKYNEGLTYSESWFLKIDLGYDIKYVIAINKLTGRSYRLSGFNTNDFLSFFTDISKSYKSWYFKKLKMSKFLKSYKVESLDFKCINKGLKQDVIDKDKYPCLRSCSDTFSIHGNG